MTSTAHDPARPTAATIGIGSLEALADTISAELRNGITLDRLAATHEVEPDRLAKFLAAVECNRFARGGA